MLIFKSLPLPIRCRDFRSVDEHTRMIARRNVVFIKTLDNNSLNPKSMLFEWWCSWILNLYHNFINNISFWKAYRSECAERERKQESERDTSSSVWLCLVHPTFIALILNGLERNHVTYDVTHCVLHSKYLSLIHRAKRLWWHRVLCGCMGCIGAKSFNISIQISC